MLGVGGWGVVVFVFDSESSTQHENSPGLYV